ncbi:hypothetical protein AVEN_242282-1, partial [Araneus ventricosus]
WCCVWLKDQPGGSALKTFCRVMVAFMLESRLWEGEDYTVWNPTVVESQTSPWWWKFERDAGLNCSQGVTIGLN